MVNQELLTTSNSKTTFVTVNRMPIFIKCSCLFHSKTTFVTVNLAKNAKRLTQNAYSKTTFVTVNQIVTWRNNNGN